jgi:hypothetical protein
VMADGGPGEGDQPGGGVDLAELYRALRALAVECDLLRREVGAARGEADRLRAALRRWHARHGGCHRRGPANQGAWGGVRW